MWFDEIMDDCKKAFKISSENKGIFIPILINAGVNLIFAIMMFVCSIIFFMVNIKNLENLIEHARFSTGLFVSIIIGFIILYLGITIIKGIFEVGSIGMYKAAVEGIKPKSQHFFEGVRKYFFKVFGTTILINLAFLVAAIPIVVLFALYTLTAGILTAGWGVVLLFVLAGIFFGAWIIIMVEDDMGAFKAILTSVKLGKKYFWGLFIIVLSGFMISNYMVSAFGTLIALFIGWFLSSIIVTYFKVVTMLIYRRKKTELI